VNQNTAEHEETLGEFLASRARRASDTLLAGHVITAVLMAIAVAAWRGPGWDIRLSIAVCFLAFGVWGIADRGIVDRHVTSRVAIRTFEAVRFAAATCGFLAAAFCALAVLARLIGPVKS
jgi:hypothetical protein